MVRVVLVALSTLGAALAGFVIASPWRAMAEGETTTALALAIDDDEAPSSVPDNGIVAPPRGLLSSSPCTNYTNTGNHSGVGVKTQSYTCPASKPISRAHGCYITGHESTSWLVHSELVGPTVWCRAYHGSAGSFQLSVKAICCS